MHEHGLQKLKASAIQLELIEHRDTRAARAQKGPNPDRVKCNKCGTFYWKEKGCGQCRTYKSSTPNRPTPPQSADKRPFRPRVNEVEDEAAWEETGPARSQEG